MDAQTARSTRKEEMFHLVEEYLKSGLSQKPFCEERHLSKSTFMYWLKKYRTENKQATGFIPINISSLNSASDYRIELPNGIRIYLNGTEGLKLIAGVISKTVGCHAAS